MKTSTKVLIAVGVLIIIRARNANAAPAALNAGATAYAPGGGTWMGRVPVTPTFAGGESGYGTSPISALFTALLGGGRAAPLPGPSASAPALGENVNDWAEPGAYSPGDSFGQAGVPGTYIDPAMSLQAGVTAADPAIMMMPLPYGDSVLWTPSPSVAG